jgi:hypothetical protein
MSTFLHYYFAEHGAPWWKAAIWGNIFASILWGFAAGFIGYFVAKKIRAAWAGLHAKLDAHHDEMHAKLDAHRESLVLLHHKIDSQAHANAQRAKALPKPSHYETDPH